MGCFAKGCLTVLIAGFIFLAGLMAVSWYLYVKTVSNLTSPGPADIQIAPPSESQFQTAENSKARLKEAIANNKETTVEFTAADLNALFSRDPGFEDWRSHIRIDIAESIMTIEVSAPLNSVALPRMKKCWFNGTASFTFTYETGNFSFDIISAQADGHQVPEIFLSSGVISSFNESMNQGFRNAMRETDGDSEFWDHVKSMSLKGDKLVVTTQAE